MRAMCGSVVGIEEGKHSGVASRCVSEGIWMSSPSGSGAWIDRWWLVLLIVFGLVFIATLAFFHPSY